MRARGRNFGVKTRPQIFLAQSSIFFNGFLISKKSEKIFFNSFPISSTAFRFLQRLSDFFNGFAFNGFPISSTAFRFLHRLRFPRNLLQRLRFPRNLLQRLRFPRNLLQRLSDNIIFQFQKLCVRTNHHSPHSLASDKAMYVEMAFQLNLYRHDLPATIKSMISICIINCNRSAHHFCAKYLHEQSPVKEPFWIRMKDFTKEGRICFKKTPTVQKHDVMFCIPCQCK